MYERVVLDDGRPFDRNGSGDEDGTKGRDGMMGLVTSRDSRKHPISKHRDVPSSFVGFVRWIHLDSFGRQSADDGTTERRNDDGTRRRGNAVPIYVDDDRGTTDATGGRRTGRATERRDTTVDDARS